MCRNPQHVPCKLKIIRVSVVSCNYIDKTKAALRGDNVMSWAGGCVGGCVGCCVGGLLGVFRGLRRWGLCLRFARGFIGGCRGRGLCRGLRRRFVMGCVGGLSGVAPGAVSRVYAAPGTVSEFCRGLRRGLCRRFVGGLSGCVGGGLLGLRRSPKLCRGSGGSVGGLSEVC